MTKIKNTLEGINRISKAEEQISELTEKNGGNNCWRAKYSKKNEKNWG